MMYGSRASRDGKVSLQKIFGTKTVINISTDARTRVGTKKPPTCHSLGGDVQIFVGDGRSGDLPIRKLSLTVTLEPGLKDTTK